MENKSMIYACVDPGLGGTGIAIYYTDNHTNFPSETVALSFPTRLGPVLNRMLMYTNAVLDTLMAHKVKRVFIEGADLNVKSAKGDVARRTNKVVTLSYLVGSIAVSCTKKNFSKSLNPAESVIIVPPTWSDLPPEALAYQLSKSIGFVTKNDHVLHAVGLGEYVKKHFSF